MRKNGSMSFAVNEAKEDSQTICSICHWVDVAFLSAGEYNIRKEAVLWRKLRS